MCRGRGAHCRDFEEDFDGTVERKCWDTHKKVRTGRTRRTILKRKSRRILPGDQAVGPDDR